MAAKKDLKKSSAAKKVNKNARPQSSTPKIKEDDIYRCSRCGYRYTKQDGNFFVSRSPIHEGNNGYMNICKKCLSVLYEDYVIFFGGDEDEAGERICQLVDMYFDENLWDGSRKGSTRRNRIGIYISKLNLNQLGKESGDDFTYSDTLIRRWDEEEARIREEAVSEARNSVHHNTPEEAIRRFGVGFKESEYEAMQAEYDTWIDTMGDPVDKRQDELYVSICYLKLNLQKNIQEGSNGTGALANAYKSFIEAATTEIEDRKKKAEAEKELKPIGMLYRDIEQFSPAEYYKDKKLYADFDKLGDYIKRFLVRPVKNLLTGSKEMDKEFNLSESEE